MNNLLNHIAAKVVESSLVLVKLASFSQRFSTSLFNHLVVKSLERIFRAENRLKNRLITTHETLYSMRLHIQRCLIFLFLALISTGLQSQSSQRLVRITAKSGDSAERLMKRYSLQEDQCNLRGFFAINSLEQGAGLIIGKKYYLPIQIFNYNGRSIRTSMSLEGWKKPLKIKEFNDQLKKKKLRSQSLVKSQLIWVPFSYLDCDQAIDGGETERMTIDTGEKNAAEEQAKANAEVEESAATGPSLDSEAPEVLLAKQKKVTGYRHFPIFGEKNANIPLIDSKLKGKVYYLVAGHGGPDPGALGEAKGKRLCEDEYAYDVTLRLCRRLLERGATVYMIIRDPNDGLRDGKYLNCDQDEYCWGKKVIPLNQKKRLTQRAEAINELYRANKNSGVTEQTAVMIHIDSRSKGENTDVFFYHFPKSKSSRSVANNLHDTFKSKYRKYRRDGNYHGTVSGRDLFMLRVTEPKAVFIELGNIRSPRDQKRFLLESNREAVAKWLYEGLIK